MFTLPSSRASSGWVAAVPQAGWLALAQVEPPQAAGGRPRVLWARREPFEQPGRTLRRLRRSLGRDERVLVLPRNQYVCQTLDVPPDLPRGDWADALRWSMKDAVQFPIEEAAIDVLAIPEGTSNRSQVQAIAVAASGTAVRPWVHQAVEAKLPWSAIDITETALRNLSSLLEPDGRAQALLHCEPDHATLVITYQGELLASRQIELGLRLDGALDHAELMRLFESAGLELQRTFDGIERNHAMVTLARLLITPMPQVEAVAERLGAMLYVPVLPMAIDDALDLDAVPELQADAAELNLHITAIGAALRGMPDVDGSARVGQA